MFTSGVWEREMVLLLVQFSQSAISQWVNNLGDRVAELKGLCCSLGNRGSILVSLVKAEHSHISHIIHIFQASRW